MATFSDLKLAIDDGLTVIRTQPTQSGMSVTLIYQDDGYYVISDLEAEHKDCWSSWENVLSCLENEWGGAEDWKIHTEALGNGLLTVPQVARRLGVDDGTIRGWIKGGRLEAVSFPGGLVYQVFRVRRATLDALLDMRQTEKVS